MTPDSRRASATATLAALRRSYQAASPELCALFAAHATRVAHGPHDSDTLEALRKDLHRVRGTAGSYGFEEVSGILAALEQRVLEWLLDPAAVDAATRSREILDAVGRLRAAFGDDGPDGPRA